MYSIIYLESIESWAATVVELVSQILLVLVQVLQNSFELQRQLELHIFSDLVKMILFCIWLNRLYMLK